MHLRPKGRLSVLAMASLACACFSEVPLDVTPTVLVDPKLVGEWTCSSSTDAGQSARLEVKAMDRHRYAVSWQVEGDERVRYVAYASSVGGRTLFNVRLDPPQSNRWWDHPWAFVEVGSTAGGIRIQLLTDGIVSGTERSSEELRSSFGRALARSDVLTEEMTVCRRRK